ncbi:MAG: hypothetical protein FWG17_03565 [Desulfovibrionaceae bacterium]|nr:hypothetical protein [Desulfovibrionaceae bacterium]
MSVPRSGPVYLAPPGLLCCAGRDREEFFRAALAGDQSGLRPHVFPGGTFLVGRVEESLLGPVEDPFDMRLLRLAGAALSQIRQQVEEAVARYGRDRVAVCAGVCDNGLECSLPAHAAWLSGGEFPEDYALRAQGPAYMAEFIARYLGLDGPAFTVSTACSSSAGALIRAAELVRAGLCDAAVAGGVDVVSELTLLGFDSLELISPEPGNPFSRNRRGINLGEGATFFLLHGPGLDLGGLELAGYGESSDAFHITAPSEDGAGAAAAMRLALEMAGISPEDVGYVNLHGTGTSLNDLAEAAAMAAVFGRQPLSGSSKPITGHTLGAAGALELALGWMVLDKVRQGIPARLPPHLWDGAADEHLPPLRLVRKGDELPGGARHVLSNSFAFGGSNVSLLLRVA